MAFLHVQSTHDAIAASAATIPLAYAGANTVGNLLVCAFTWGTTDVTPTCSDSVNGAWTEIGTHAWDATNTQGLAMFYLANCAAGTPTVTASFAATSVPFRGILIAEYSGASTSLPLDTSISNPGAVAGTGTDNATSTAFVPGAANRLVFGALVITGSGTSLVAGTNYVERQQTASAIIDSQIQDRVLAPSGSQSALWSITNSERYNAIAAVFKEPAAGGDTLFAQAIF